MNGHPLMGLARLPADVLTHAIRRAGDHPRHQDAQIVECLTGGDGIDDLTGHDRLLGDALDIHQRSSPRDGDRLVESPDLQLAIDRRRGRTDQLDPVADEGAETRQGERHRVGAGLERNDEVLARPVADGRARLFDERGAAGHGRDPWQHAPVSSVIVPPTACALAAVAPASTHMNAVKLTPHHLPIVSPQIWTRLHL